MEQVRMKRSLRDNRSRLSQLKKLIVSFHKESKENMEHMELIVSSCVALDFHQTSHLLPMKNDEQVVAFFNEPKNVSSLTAWLIRGPEFHTQVMGYARSILMYLCTNEYCSIRYYPSPQ